MAIAGALAMASHYLVLDEPTSMLDPKRRSMVIDSLKKLYADMGMGIIYVTNIMEEALLAQRVLVLEDGQVIKDAPPSEVFSDYDWLRERNLNMPHICRLGWMLAEAGFENYRGLLSREDMLEELCK